MGEIKFFSFRLIQILHPLQTENPIFALEAKNIIYFFNRLN